jgi:hypothetical protein
MVEYLLKQSRARSEQPERGQSGDRQAQGREDTITERGESEPFFNKIGEA